MTPDLDKVADAARALVMAYDGGQHDLGPFVIRLLWVIDGQPEDREPCPDPGAHDPIETGREAALGQWEARWTALRAALVASGVGMAVESVFARVEAEIPTGLPVGERWTPRMAGRVNLQLEPERTADLFACLLKCGVEWTGEDRHAVAALLSDLMIQAKAQGMTEAAWEKVL